MKYPQLVSMPSAVSDWLEEQLEARGIDAVVYTRYVLSLLYRDPVDIICPDHSQDPSFYRELQRSGGRRKGGCYWTYADADQLKRSAAVECLKSASDQKCGIESLVDELCAKLKEIQEREAHSSASVAVVAPLRAVKEKDSAKRYYAAFPALTRHPSPKLVQIVPKAFTNSPKRRCYGGARKQRPPEMNEMRTRSLGKQRFNYFARNTADGTAGGGDNTSTRKNLAHFYNNNNNNEKQLTPTKLKEDPKATDAMDMYNDLPVDIHDLLDSPTPRRHVDLLNNMANMRDAGSKSFIQCGTNIISSIWSTHKENAEDVLNDQPAASSAWRGSEDSYLDLKFSNLWSATGAASTSVDVIDDECDMWHYQTKWSDGNDAEHYLALSLSKLNHSRERSCFVEVKPRHHANVHTYGAPARTKSGPPPVDSDDKDDLLYSKASHFKPIHEKTDAQLAAAAGSKHYANGTTFAIPSHLEQIRYEPADDGELFVDDAGGVRRRYFAYKSSDDTFLLHFAAVQNDKACQMSDDDDEIDVEVQLANAHVDDVSLVEDFFDGACASRPDSVMAELFGKDAKCDKCSSSKSSAWRRDNGNIWNGEICMACLSGRERGNVTPMDERSRQLRDDIKEDGEQLLSDLSSLQKSYMEEEEEEDDDDNDDDLPMAEETCNLNALIDVEWRVKPHAGGVPVHSASFSFATRLQQDCLLKMATIPTLRSVTL